MKKSCPYGKNGDRLWVREAWGLKYIPDNARQELLELIPQQIVLEDERVTVRNKAA